MRIISLFDYTGIWSRPYVEAGYDVMRVDRQLGQDIYDLEPPGSPVRGIIMQPPCTDFARCGARWFAAKDADGRTAESVRLVRHALTWIAACEPDWWVLENPAGRLARLVPELGPWRMTFSPHEFGEPWRKLTCLWGDFNTHLVKSPAAFQGARPGQPDAWYSAVGGTSQRTKNYRSRTSPLFARAFFEANP